MEMGLWQKRVFEGLARVVRRGMGREGEGVGRQGPTSTAGDQCHCSLLPPNLGA